MTIPGWQSRTELLIGKENLEKLAASHVLIAGLGGVGGYVAEQLCRAGIGTLTLIDHDLVQPSNINRQIIALHSSCNKYKVELIETRLKDINPGIETNLLFDYLKDDNIDQILDREYDYIVDAIDTLTPKVNFLEKAFNRKHNIVSSMGAGGRKDPSCIEISDISKSHHCKFAYIVRKYLHRKGIYKGIKVVFSYESVRKDAIQETDGSENKRSIVGTISYMPAIFGCYCSSVVINDLIK